MGTYWKNVAFASFPTTKKKKKKSLIYCTLKVVTRWIWIKNGVHSLSAQKGLPLKNYTYIYHHKNMLINKLRLWNSKFWVGPQCLWNLKEVGIQILD